MLIVFPLGAGVGDGVGVGVGAGAGAGLVLTPHEIAPIEPPGIVVQSAPVKSAAKSEAVGTVAVVRAFTNYES